jgi:hypothetical protein
MHAPPQLALGFDALCHMPASCLPRCPTALLLRACPQDREDPNPPLSPDLLAPYSLLGPSIKASALLDAASCCL